MTMKGDYSGIRGAGLLIAFVTVPVIFEILWGVESLKPAHSVVFPIAHTLALAACGFVPWVLCKHAGAVRDSPRLWFLAEPAAVIAGYFGAKYILSMTAISRTFDFPEVVIYRAGVFALVTAIGLFFLTPVVLDRGWIGKPTAVEHPRRWPRHGILRTDGCERSVADE